MTSYYANFNIYERFKYLTKVSMIKEEVMEDFMEDKHFYEAVGRIKRQQGRFCKFDLPHGWPEEAVVDHLQGLTVTEITPYTLFTWDTVTEEQIQEYSL